MKLLLATAAFILAIVACDADTATFRMSMPDRYTVRDTAEWQVSVLKKLDLRFADVRVLPKKTKAFDLRLYFYCDTKDLARFDTPQKMKKALVESSDVYLGHIIEKQLVIEAISNKGWFGFKTKITDASLANAKTIPDGEYLYIIRGMIRLSEDTALGFSLMTNEPDSAETDDIFRYIYSFAKEKQS
jgi:hypothetical protein